MMSEEKNTNQEETKEEEKKDEFAEKLNAFKDEALKAMKETVDTVVKKLDTEKRKAEIKSEIGHTSRDLSKSYEKLGRQYFLNKEQGLEIGGEEETFELIRSKEKLIELLNEKLDHLEGE